jgi:hypothetical protein
VSGVSVRGGVGVPGGPVSVGTGVGVGSGVGASVDVGATVSVVGVPGIAVGTDVGCAREGEAVTGTVGDGAALEQAIATAASSTSNACSGRE